MQSLFLTGVGLGILIGGASMYLLLARFRRAASAPLTSNLSPLPSNSPPPDPAPLRDENDRLQQRLLEIESLLSQQAMEIVATSLEARTDPLTQLNNRRNFNEQLAQRMLGERNSEQSVGIILIDVDHFKRLNDVHGHLAGDAVLQQLAELLRRTQRPGAVLARLGGEEFAVMTSAKELGPFGQQADALREAVARTIFTHDEHWLRVTISCGAAIATMHESSESLLARCDAALYAAKSAGRNAVFCHDGYRALAIAQSLDTDQYTQPAPVLGRDFDIVCGELRARLEQLVVTGP